MFFKSQYTNIKNSHELKIIEENSKNLIHVKNHYTNFYVILLYFYFIYVNAKDFESL